MKLKPLLPTLCSLLALAVVPIKAPGQEPVQASIATVAFQGSGTATWQSREVPFGFSIRCYGVRCAGALSFGSASAHYVTGTVRALQPEMFLISVSNATTALPSTTSSSCALVNQPPITRGSTNKVTLTCAAPAFAAISDNAVVIVSAAGQ